MRKCLIAFILLFCVIAHAEFLSGTDIPLTDDMIVDENESFSFDSPAGQILTISAKTTMAPAQLRSFYKESLTALGWRQMSGSEYRRDQDELSLQITPTKGGSTLKLQLTYANK